MPILTLECPDCGHIFKGAVFLGTKPPDVWECSQCLGKRSAQAAGTLAESHPWEISHAGCRCCG